MIEIGDIRMDWINLHREATGHARFERLTDDEIEEQIILIEDNAPYGVDPWAGEEGT